MWVYYIPNASFEVMYRFFTYDLKYLIDKVRVHLEIKAGPVNCLSIHYM